MQLLLLCTRTIAHRSTCQSLSPSEAVSPATSEQVTAIVDPADEFDLFNEGVTFYGTPGASGWADKIGDVAVHYMSSRWVVFSKIFPFFEQVRCRPAGDLASESSPTRPVPARSAPMPLPHARFPPARRVALTHAPSLRCPSVRQSESRAAHEDVLLLGSTKHVMLTPNCAWRIAEGGLNAPSTPITCLTGDGGTMRTRAALTVSKAPPEVIHRLYLTWGHEESDYALEARQFSFDLQALIDAHASTGEKAKRFLGTFANRLVNGQKKVQENWLRYPALPLEPTYYAQLLATAVSMTEAEQRTRAM